MAHTPKPFFRTSRDAWYVQLGKKQIKLCDGPKNSETEKSAWAEFHKLMASPAPGPLPAKKNDPDGLSVAEVFDKYMGWCEKHRSARTYEWTKNHIQSFIDHLPDPFIPHSALKPFHVVEWVDGHPTWGGNHKRGAMIAVGRPFNWAAKLGYIPANPLSGLEKPKAKRREKHLTPEEFAVLLANYKEGDPFRDLLEFMWECGCRPEEARHVEPRHLNRKLKRFDIPAEEAKGKKRVRLIRMTDRAFEIVEKRLAKCKLKVFENEDGNPWTASAINCRFNRLKNKSGTKHFAYSIRHGFATRKLVEGHDHLTVAELLGHANGQMLATVYQHLNQHEDHLRGVLEKKTTSA